MRLNFEKIIIHNFLSIGDIELNLTGRGYTLVEGHNANPGDGALSNGSGKSSIWNAICWVLTGETIQGLKSNIPNIHGEDGCYVKLFLTVDKDSYEITRYREYTSIKNDLKIIINGEDKSGKGLRESEDLLAQYLPDLTSDLIGNVILLGQGLPHKFSDNTPSGRKELLEKLSKSDFMIQDIKNRINIRTADVEEDLRNKQDNLLSFNTTLNLLSTQLDAATNELNSLNDSELKLKLSEAEDNKNSLSNVVSSLNAQLEKANSDLDILRVNSSNEINKLNEELLKLNDKYSNKLDDLQSTYYKLSADYKALNTEIITLDNVKDVCPTCGQKLPDVHKVDTSDKKLELVKLTEAVNSAQVNYQEEKGRKEQEESVIRNKLTEENNKSTSEINSLMVEVNRVRNDLQNNNILLKSAEELVIKYTADLNNFDENKNRLVKTISDLTSQIADYTKLANDQQEGIEEITSHLDALNKISTLIKRDFRGLLLKNVIDFINNKVKEYCKYVFNTSNLEIFLDGNNLNITYDNKDYANLSGGEKQKVDIVTQFTIRDMMCKYLGFSSNILVVDEIFDALDATGVQGVLDLINNILTDVDSLFIISHHAAELDISYDDKIIVQKDEKGVSKLI